MTEPWVIAIVSGILGTVVGGLILSAVLALLARGVRRSPDWVLERLTPSAWRATWRRRYWAWQAQVVVWRYDESSNYSLVQVGEQRQLGSVADMMSWSPGGIDDAPVEGRLVITWYDKFGRRSVEAAWTKRTERLELRGDPPPKRPRRPR